METASIAAPAQRPAEDQRVRDAFNDVNMEDFLKLLITELRHQDPLDPMNNSEILQQVGQIREIESNVRLSETLQAVRLGQALATASSLIGRYVEALTAEGERIVGRVERVSIVDGKPVLHIDGQEVQLENIAEILAEPVQQDSESY